MEHPLLLQTLKFTQQKTFTQKKNAAAESKQPPALADNLNYYINQNLVIRDMLRYSMESQLTAEDWEKVFTFVKNNYFY